MKSPVFSKGILVIYWDYDSQVGSDRSLTGPKEWGGYEEYIQTERLLEILDKYNIKCTFAIVGYAAVEGTLPYHCPEQIQRIAQHGHEIASHSHKHELIPDLTYEQLINTLTESKQILEVVTKQKVISFVPPFNLPARFVKKSAFSFHQRRVSKNDNIDIPTLLKALKKTGYRTCRIYYETLLQGFRRRILKVQTENSYEPEFTNGILCFRLSCAAGFGENARRSVESAIRNRNIAAVYAHPHSLAANNLQNLDNLVSFLDYVKPLEKNGTMEVCTAKEIYQRIEELC